MDIPALTNCGRPSEPTHYSDSDALTRCVAALGFRFTDRDAAALGVASRHLDAAVIYGIAKVAKITTNPVTHAHTTTYLVFA